MKPCLLPALVLALAGVSTTAHAGSFLDLQAGRSDVDFDLADYGSTSDKDTAFSVRAGWYVNDNFGVEGFYTRAYDESHDGASLQASAIGAGVVGKKNFGADGYGFFIDGRAGIARGKLEAAVEGVGRDTAESYDPYVGVGVGYDFNRSFGVSLNYDRLSGDDNGIDVTADVLTFGLEFRTE